MEMLSKKSKCFVIALLSFCLIILPAYLNFSILDESDITLSYPVLAENDQDDSIPSSQKGRQIFKLIFSIEHISIEHILIAQPFLAWVPNLLDQPSAFDPKSPILRC